MSVEKTSQSIANVIGRDGKCKIWDLGPERPAAPVAPVEPKKTGKTADDDLAAVQFEDAREDYKNALRAYGALKKEYDDWRENTGGPRVVYLWGVDATHACSAFPNRYVVNLPSGMKPGRAQLAAEAQAAEEQVRLQELLERDPQFGTKPQLQGAAQ
jgi:hypothetical protein